MTTNLFELASRQKLRFPSVRGELTVEQLWDLPLTSKSGADLDTVAKSINADLKASTEESFVATAANPLKERLQLMLDIVKHVIATRIAEADKARRREARAAERQRLTALLDKRNDEELAGLSKEDLQARIAALDSDA